MPLVDSFKDLFLLFVINAADDRCLGWHRHCAPTGPKATGWEQLILSVVTRAQVLGKRSINT